MDNIYYRCRDCGCILKGEFEKCPKCFGEDIEEVYKCEGTFCDNYSDNEIKYCKECEKYLQNFADDILNYLRSNYENSEDEYKYMINYLYNRFNK